MILNGWCHISKAMWINVSRKNSSNFLYEFMDDGLLIIMWLKVQYIPRNMHTFFALLCFVVVIHWLIFPYPSGLLHCHRGNLTIAPVPAKQPWRIWINTSCKFIMNDCITTSKQSTTKPCAYFLGYTVFPNFDKGMRHYGIIWIAFLRLHQLLSFFI